MKVLIYSFVFCLLLGCKAKIEKPENSTALQCAGSFMQCLYKGKFDQANTIMVQDSANTDCLNKSKFNYNQVMSKEQKLKYKKAAVQFIKTIVENQNVYLFELSDPISNKKIPTLKVIKKQNEWLVDFTYSCSGNL